MWQIGTRDLVGGGRAEPRVLMGKAKKETAGRGGGCPASAGTLELRALSSRAQGKADQAHTPGI